MMPLSFRSFPRRAGDAADGGMRLFVSLLAAAILIFVYLMWTGYQSARQTADDVVDNLAGLLSSNLQDMLQRGESNLWGFVHLLRPEDLTRPLSEARRQEINGILADHLLAFPQAVAYRVFDAAGQMVFAAGAALPELPVADSAWFRMLRDDPAQRLGMSERLPGKGAVAPCMAMGMALHDGEGRFVGAVTVVLTFAPLRQLASAAQLGSHGVLTIRRTDSARLLLRLPEGESREFPQPKELIDHLRSGAATGRGSLVSPVDHLYRRYAFSLVPGYPMAVTAAVAAKDYLRAWRWQALLLAIAETGLLLLLGWLFLRQRRGQIRLTAVHQALERSTGLLRDSEERFRATFEQAAAGLIHSTLDGELLRFNRKFCDIVGYPPERMASLRWRHLCHPLDLPVSAEACLRLLDDHVDSAVCESRVVRGDGRTVWVRLTSSLQHDDTGDPTHYITVVEDITRRRHTETLLQIRLRLAEAPSLAGMLAGMLDEACALLDSPVSFYYFVGPDQATLSLQAWSCTGGPESGVQPPDARAADLLRPGLWADCLRRRQSVIYDGPADFPQGRRLSAGHAALERVILVPVLRQDRIVALVGLGNKAAPYDREDLTVLETLADMAWDLAQRKQAEEQLARERNRFQQLLRTASDGLHVLDENGNLVEYSRSFLAMLGYAADQAEGLNLADWAAEVPPAQVKARVAELSGTSTVFETTYRRRDGSLFPVEISAHGVVLEGRPYCYASSRDISERQAEERGRRQVEAELRATNGRLSSVLETAAEGVIGLDAGNRVMFVNQAAVGMLGWPSAAAMQGQPSWQALGHRLGDGQPCLEGSCAIRQTLEDGVTRRVADESFLGLTGICHPVEYVVSPLREEERIVGVVVVFHDISERRKAEREIRTLLSQQKAILANTPIGIAILSLERRILQANEAFCAVYGLTAEQMVGQPAAALYASPEQYAAVGEASYSQILEGGVYREDVLMHRADGRAIWVRLVGHMVDPGDPGLGVVWAAEDISARKAMESDLRRSNTELEAFAYVASHDLRQPLRQIASYVTLLERGYADRLDDEGREFIAFARSGAERMDRLILDLLEYSRIGRTTSSMEPQSLRDAVAEAMFNLQPAITESRARLMVELSETLPPVWANTSELVRLFQNLIDNAVKYRRADGVPEIRVSACPNGGMMEVAVADNGIGIAPEHFERVFGIFQRLHRREDYEGTGIGLASCRKIVEHHKGRIWVESAPGQGATFHVALPLAR